MAGAVAGLVSESMLHPFDTVSHRAKVHPQARYGSWIGAYGLIVREEGLRGLIAGVSVTLLVSGPANAAYFWTYTQLKNRVRCLPRRCCCLCRAINGGSLRQ